MTNEPRLPNCLESALAKVVKTEKDACGLAEAGFDYVCDFDGSKISGKKQALGLWTNPMNFRLQRAGGGIRTRALDIWKR